MSIAASPASARSCGGTRRVGFGVDALQDQADRLGGRNARRNASMAASGFLRARWLCTSNMNKNRNSSATDASSRPGPRVTTHPHRGAMTGGMRMTGIGEIGASAEAMKELPTQISS